jgi:UDP-glucose 4-epimerase
LRNSVGFEIDKLIIFRFPNVLGTPSTHGVIHDWILQASKNKLVNVLGDGSQRKQYLNVRTLISCMTALYKKINSDIEILNIGPNDDGVSVKELMNIFLNFWPNQLEVSYEQKNTGWRGDINRYRLDVSKISKMGITPELKSLTEVEKSIFEMVRFSKS